MLNMLNRFNGNNNYNLFLFLFNRFIKYIVLSYVSTRNNKW